MSPVSESFWGLIQLAVAVALMSPCRASEYEYFWKLDVYNGGRSYGKPPQCVGIPDDLRLCHNVGYNQMLLPNLLEHETMAEVKQQASSWVPLVHKNCHPGTQVFLCSLFAPVCLERPIYPCRWLCEAVRDGCIPIMEAFGFPWPEMLTCDKFPQDDVCIAMTQPNATEATKPTGNSRVRALACFSTPNGRECARVVRPVEIAAGTVAQSPCKSVWVGGKLPEGSGSFPRTKRTPKQLQVRPF